MVPAGKFSALHKRFSDHGLKTAAGRRITFQLVSNCQCPWMGFESGFMGEAMRLDPIVGVFGENHRVEGLEETSRDHLVQPP